MMEADDLPHQELETRCRPTLGLDAATDVLRREFHNIELVSSYKQAVILMELVQS